MKSLKYEKFKIFEISKYLTSLFLFSGGEFFIRKMGKMEQVEYFDSKVSCDLLNTLVLKSIFL